MMFLQTVGRLGVIALALLWNTAAEARLDMDKFVGAWLFDEGDGDEVSDASGNDHLGVITGNDWDWIDGKFGGAVRLGGGGERIAIDEFGSVMPISDITILIWARIDDADFNQDLLSLEPLSPGRVTVHMPWERANGLMGVHWPFGDPQFGRAVLNLPDGLVGEWQHWAFVSSREENLVYYYINGAVPEELLTSGANEFGPRPDPFYIGGRSGSTFTGAVDEVAVYEGAVSKADISEIMEEGLGRTAFGEAVEPAGKLATAWGRIKNLNDRSDR